MKKIVKIIGAAGAVAAAAALVPYHFKSDKDSGEFELGGLLWKLRKEAGEEEDTYTMELLPFINKKVEEQEAAIDANDFEVEMMADDAAVEEPFADKSGEESEIVVEPAEEKEVEEPFAEEDTEAVVEIEVEEAPADAPAAEEAPATEEAAAAEDSAE